MSARTDYVSALFHAMAAWPCASVDVKAVVCLPARIM